MSDLKTDQLDAIHRLLVEPLREAIRQELRLSHQRLASTIDNLDQRIAGRVTDHDQRLVAVERTVSQFRAFRARILAVYGALTLLLSLGWSVVRDKLLSHFTRP